MKTPFLNRKSKGFTLIELLVVIAIILTLAGIAMTVVNGVMDRADEDRKLNPKKTAYFNTTTTDVEGAPGLFFESRGRVGLMDPWESPYYIILNANPDDRTPRVQVGSRMVTKNVAVYSTGKDKQGSTADGHINNPELTEDNVTSW